MWLIWWAADLIRQDPESISPLWTKAHLTDFGDPFRRAALPWVVSLTRTVLVCGTLWEWVWTALSCWRDRILGCLPLFCESRQAYTAMGTKPSISPAAAGRVSLEHCSFCQPGSSHPGNTKLWTSKWQHTRLLAAWPVVWGVGPAFLLWWWSLLLCAVTPQLLTRLLAPSLPAGSGASPRGAPAVAAPACLVQSCWQRRSFLGTPRQCWLWQGLLYADSHPVLTPDERAFEGRTGIHTSNWTWRNAKHMNKTPRMLCILLGNASGVRAAWGALSQQRWQQGQRGSVCMNASWSTPSMCPMIDSLWHRIICTAAINEHSLKDQIKEMSIMLIYFCYMYQCLMFKIIRGGRGLMPKLNWTKTLPKSGWLAELGLQLCFFRTWL